MSVEPANTGTPCAGEKCVDGQHDNQRDAADLELDWWKRQAADLKRQLVDAQAQLEQHKATRCDGCGGECFDFRQRDGKRICILCVEGDLAQPPPPAPEPTHRCKVCGALWRLNPADPITCPPPHPFSKETWSCVVPAPGRDWGSPCGPCCDNAPMGEQVEALTPPTRAKVADCPPRPPTTSEPSSGERR